jgi:hypothetical protein
MDEIATDPTLKSLQKKVESLQKRLNRSKKREHRYYRRWRPRAEKAKISIQFTIAIAICIILVCTVVSWIWPSLILIVQGYTGVDLHFFSEHHPLQIVSYGLALSAGFELAYMLFTEGPDEAIEPLILGLSASLLYIIDLDKQDILVWEKTLVVIVFVIAIYILFVIKNNFIDPKKEQAESKSLDPK